MADTRNLLGGQPDQLAFPRHRVRPVSGWVNDPTGPIRWHGRFHVFFQHNPHSATHDRISWGHASSDNLVQWHYEPVALVPTPDGPDAAGCWSGCVVDDDGVATAVYTGASRRESVCLAIAQDDRLRSWEKVAKPVAEAPLDRALLGFRDPFVFRHGGHRYAVLGSGEPPNGKALLLLYRCDDLMTWTYQGTLLDASDDVAAQFAAADFWECPQLFQIGNRWVLIVSLIVGQQANRVCYLVGDLVTTDSGPRFIPVGGGRVDHGHDFYAPAVLSLADRTLLWGWTWEDRPESEVHEAGWAGALTLTRDLVLTDDGELRSSPAAELSVLHDDVQVVELVGPSTDLRLPSGPVDLDVEVTSDHDGVVVLTLQGALELELDLVSGTATVRKDVHAPWRREWQVSGQFSPTGLRRRVRGIIDASVVEIFVEHGPSFTERIYAHGPSTMRIQGGAASKCLVSVRRLADPASQCGLAP